MPENERKKIVGYLSRCSDRELRDILFAVFQVRRPNPEEDEYNKNCFFLGTASSLLENGKGEPKHWGAYKIEAIAHVDREECGENVPAIDWGFCQFGECQQCGIAVRSNLKHGVCPLCGSKVYMS
ncbi:hypothetical protein [Phormidesmis priestleyi]|nr:hypothetical protein [Phormidesmis priestleyi]